MIKLSSLEFHNIIKDFSDKGILRKGKSGSFCVKNNIPQIVYSSKLNFLHEYIHFKQWENGLRVKKSFKEAVKDQDFESFKNIIKIELDCEKKVLEFIYKKNRKDYIKRINTYLFLCHEIFKGKRIDFMKKNMIYDKANTYLLKDKDYLYSPHLLIN